MSTDDGAADWMTKVLQDIDQWTELDEAIDQMLAVTAGTTAPETHAAHVRLSRAIEQWRLGTAEQLAAEQVGDAQ